MTAQHGRPRERDAGLLVRVSKMRHQHAKARRVSYNRMHGAMARVEKHIRSQRSRVKALPMRVRMCIPGVLIWDPILYRNPVATIKKELVTRTRTRVCHAASRWPSPGATKMKFTLKAAKETVF